jgi:hypothetical protein
MKKTLIIIATLLFLFAGCADKHEEGGDHKHHAHAVADRQALVDNLIKECEKNEAIVEILLLGFEIKQNMYMDFYGLETKALAAMSQEFGALFEANERNVKKLNEIADGIMVFNTKFERTKSGQITNKQMKLRVTLQEARQMEKSVADLKALLEIAKKNNYSFKF